MYRSYIKNQAAITASTKEMDPSDGCSVSDELFDEDIQNKVKQVWDEVEKQCQSCVPYSANDNIDLYLENKRDWNIVRVFVSSTFTDFFSEREVLVKKVFPELREWCRDCGLKLMECDLRWGVPKDTSTADTILICLDEIERCRETNKGQPFFIGMIGEKYGWMPTEAETPNEVKEKYGWIDGSSITFMEMLLGSYREKNPNAAIFFRDKVVYDAIPETFLNRFMDMSPLARLHLKTMKKKFYERFPDQIFPYTCKYKQISKVSGREQVELVELDTFAEKVLNFLKNAIERTYPHSKTTESEADETEQEQDLQWLFVLDKAKELIGRHSELEILKEYVLSGTSSSLEKMEDVDHDIGNVEDWDLHESDKKICVLEGSSGWGKTALMCKLIMETVKSGAKAFFHIVSSTPASIRVDSILKRLLSLLIPQPLEEEKAILASDNNEQLIQLWHTALSSYSKQSEKLIILIDGLNEFENSETNHHLSWLPPAFPHNIHCVVSTNLHQPTLARICKYPTLKMTLQSMTPDDLSAVAVKYLEAFNKKLNQDQLNNLLLKSGVDNPLWMMLMAEELRVFGDFRLLDEKINNFPNNMEDLLTQIIDRLIQEDDENNVIKKVLCLIACSRFGLPSDKNLQVCGNIESREELAPLYWARAYRSLKPYLRVYGGMEKVIAFSHEYVLKAVRSHLLASQHDVVSWHTVWADYYQYWCTDSRIKVYHLPYHLEEARLHKRLLEFMQSDPDSYKLINPWLRSHLLRNVRCRVQVGTAIPLTSPILLCQMCALRVGGYNPGCYWQNEKCCVLCGAFIFTGKSIPAFACMRHSQHLGPHLTKCVLCNCVVILNAPNVNHAQLCRQCGFGFGDKTCARFDVT